MHNFEANGFLPQKSSKESTVLFKAVVWRTGASESQEQRTKYPDSGLSFLDSADHHAHRLIS